jgi:hypothetical protein
MSGCWVTWPAEIRTRPDIADIGPYLAHAVAALREHRDVEDAAYEYLPGSGVVNFVLRVRWGITEVVAKRQASDALHDRLPAAGFDTARSGPTWQAPVAWLRFDWWPSSFKWWW